MKFHWIFVHCRRFAAIFIISSFKNNFSRFFTIFRVVPPSKTRKKSRNLKNQMGIGTFLWFHGKFRDLFDFSDFLIFWRNFCKNRRFSRYRETDGTDGSIRARVSFEIVHSAIFKEESRVLDPKPSVSVPETELFWPGTENNSGLDSRFRNRGKKKSHINSVSYYFLLFFKRYY